MTSLPRILMRAAVGFVVGWLVAYFILALAGWTHFHQDLSRYEWEYEHAGRRLALYLACGAAILTIFVGGAHISIYWVWAPVILGAICLVPFFIKLSFSLFSGESPGGIIPSPGEAVFLLLATLGVAWYLINRSLD